MLYPRSSSDNRMPPLRVAENISRISYYITLNFRQLGHSLYLYLAEILVTVTYTNETKNLITLLSNAV